MKIATFILGLILSGIMGLQTCAVYGLGSVADAFNKESGASAATTASAGGLFVVFLSLIAMAFTLGKPVASVVFYVAGGLLALGLSASFPDLKVWGIAMLILAVMAWFSRSKKLKDVALQSA